MTHVSESIRQQVRKRANQRCEYCRKPEGISTYGHHLDHIIPVRHGGLELLTNYAWACFDCNIGKGTDVASYDEETKTLTPLFNPRTQVWADHFKMDGLPIVGKTPSGRVTVRLLDMNHPNQIEARRILIEAGLW